MIAESIIRSILTTEPGLFMGEVDTLKDSYILSDGCFVEEIDNNTYRQFIKQHGLVNIMSKYWDCFVEERTQEANLKRKLIL